MLGTRLIACLVVKNGIAVQSIGFSKYLPVCRVEIAVEYLSRWGIDEIVIVDIDASRAGRSFDLEMAQAAAGAGFVPLTLGGGIKSVAEIRMLLKQGADKICLNNSARLNPGLISEAAKVFGSQCIVVSIDATFVNGEYKVYDYSLGREIETNVLDFAKECEKLGAGEIFLNSVANDGLKQGFDLDLINLVCKAVSIPVIVIGGAGHPSHFLDVLKQAKASGVAAGNYFHFFEHSVIATKNYLRKNLAVKDLVDPNIKGKESIIRPNSYVDYKGISFDEMGRPAKKDEDFLESQRFEFHPEEII